MHRNLTYILGGVLSFTFLVSIWMTPSEIVAESHQDFVLEDIIPNEFGGWAVVPQVSSGSQISLYANRGENVQDIIYEQTLLRTYKNQKGDSVMLAIAYGAKQTKELKVHRPEVCYIVQGFEILEQEKDLLNIGNVAVPVRKVVARSGNRMEPITYWIRIGDRLLHGGSVEVNLALIREGLIGRIPDGLLFRVSSVNSDPKAAFSVQQEFISNIVSAISPKDRRNFLGSISQI